MLENTVTLQVQPGKLQTAMAVLHEQVGPILIAQPCLLSLRFLPDERAGCITVLSAWAQGFSPAAIESLPAYRRAIAMLDGLLVEPALTPQPSQQQN